MRAQMHEHLPVPLEAQARESREQLAEVQYALKNSYVPPPNAPITHHHRQGARFEHCQPLLTCVNSYYYREARRQNSNLRPSPSNLADSLAVVVKPDGSQSALYPTDLRSLFSYDGALSLPSE